MLILLVIAGRQARLVDGSRIARWNWNLGEGLITHKVRHWRCLVLPTCHHGVAQVSGGVQGGQHTELAVEGVGPRAPAACRGVCSGWPTHQACI